MVSRAFQFDYLSVKLSLLWFFDRLTTFVSLLARLRSFLDAYITRAPTRVHHTCCANHLVMELKTSPPVV